MQAVESKSDPMLNTDLLATVVPEHPPIIEDTLEEEKRKQFVGMTILDIIDIYVHNKWNLNVGSDDENYFIHIGYFQFLSRESIQWYCDTSGYRFFPYLYIIDADNLRIEVFTFLGRSEEIHMGSYCSTQKYYININKDQLIDYYLKNKRQFETYVTTEFFRVSITEEQEKERNGYFFRVFRDALVYGDNAMQGKELGMVYDGNMVKVVDMHYQNLSDRYPVAVKIETENLSGWVDVDIVDFIHLEG